MDPHKMVVVWKQKLNYNLQGEDWFKKKCNVYIVIKWK
jgi:hypothetical protein